MALNDKNLERNAQNISDNEKKLTNLSKSEQGVRQQI